MDDRPLWTIGELAENAGVSARTIRHYEDESLLHPAARTASGYRLFDEATTHRLYRIVALRGLGFGIDDIRTLLDSADPATALRETAERHLGAVDRQIAAATQLRDRLAKLVADDDAPPDLTLEITAMTVALDRIVTRTGDDGTTAIVGRRVRKDDDRVEALGAVDELNVAIGVALTQADVKDSHVAPLTTIQHRLFDLGADLADEQPDGPARVGATELDVLDAVIGEVTEGHDGLASFLIPGGTPYAAHLHACRTAARRAERRVVALRAHDDAVRYLNRLSDLFFVLARGATDGTGTLWAPLPATSDGP